MEKGQETGNYLIDIYGCWWEIKWNDGTVTWIMGEYPENYYGKRFL